MHNYTNVVDNYIHFEHLPVGSPEQFLSRRLIKLVVSRTYFTN